MKCPVCDTDFEGEVCSVCHAPVDLGGDPERWYEHGRNHWRSGRHGWASRSLERTVELDPTMVKGWIALGIARRDSGEFLTAIECFDRAIEVDPADDKAYYNKSVTLSERGIFRDALRVLDEGISEGGGLVLLLAKGDILMDLERYEEALDVYDEALKINPEYKVTLFSRQKCLAKLESSRAKEKPGIFRRLTGGGSTAGTEVEPEPKERNGDKPPLIRTMPPEGKDVPGQGDAPDGEVGPPEPGRPAPDMKEAAADATRRRLFRFRGAPQEKTGLNARGPPDRMRKETTGTTDPVDEDGLVPERTGDESPNSGK